MWYIESPFVTLWYYEFALYLEIEKGLDKGTVTVKDSFNYKSLDDELIDFKLWKKDNNNDIIFYRKTGVALEFWNYEMSKLFKLIKFAP